MKIVESHCTGPQEQIRQVWRQPAQYSANQLAQECRISFSRSFNSCFKRALHASRDLGRRPTSKRISGGKHTFVAWRKSSLKRKFGKTIDCDYVCHYGGEEINEEQLQQNLVLKRNCYNWMLVWLMVWWYCCSWAHVTTVSILMWFN